MIIGRVIRGDRIGRTIGFPTANVACAHFGAMRQGLYAVAVRIGRGTTMHPGLLHYGPRKVFHETRQRAEVFLLSFRGSLYGKKLFLRLGKRLRAIRHFSSVPALQKQLRRDVLAAERFFACHASFLAPPPS